jgi:hypothetical protein
MNTIRRDLLNVQRENFCVDDEFITPHFITIENKHYISTVSGTRTRKKIA